MTKCYYYWNMTEAYWEGCDDGILLLKCVIIKYAFFTLLQVLSILIYGNLLKEMEKLLIGGTFKW